MIINNDYHNLTIISTYNLNFILPNNSGSKGSYGGSGTIFILISKKISFVNFNSWIKGYGGGHTISIPISSGYGGTSYNVKGNV